MGFERRRRWFQTPVPTLLLGVVALGVAAFGAAMWLDDQNRLGELTGAVAGTVGALIGIRDRRSR